MSEANSAKKSRQSKPKARQRSPLNNAIRVQMVRAGIATQSQLAEMISGNDADKAKAANSRISRWFSEGVEITDEDLQSLIDVFHGLPVLEELLHLLDQLGEGFEPVDVVVNKHGSMPNMSDVRNAMNQGLLNNKKQTTIEGVRSIENLAAYIAAENESFMKLTHWVDHNKRMQPIK